jgi:hypothetical protein
MKKNNETEALNELIRVEESKQAYELVLLKEQFHMAQESLKPMNLIKEVLHDVTASPQIKDNLLNNVIGLGTGLLSKKLLMFGAKTPLKNTAGTLVGLAVANLVSNNVGSIKSIGSKLLKGFFKRKAH